MKMNKTNFIYSIYKENILEKENNPDKNSNNNKNNIPTWKEWLLVYGEVCWGVQGISSCHISITVCCFVCVRV